MQSKIEEHFAIVAAISEQKKAELPLQLWPEKVQNIVNHFSHFRSYPKDFFAVSILTAIGSAIGNSHILKTPDGYDNRANIYIALVANPGLNKTAPVNCAYKPILAKQAAMYKQWLSEQPKGNEKATKRKSKKDVNDIDNQSIINEKEEKENKEGVFFTKPILSDCTTEALIKQLSRNDKGVTIVYDELAGFLNSFNRYSKGNDEQLYLSLWQGTHISRDTLNNGTIEVPNPFVSIIGTIQPTVLQKCFTDKIDNGSLDRFLICYLNDLKKPYPQGNDVDPIIENQYYDILNTLSDLYLNETTVLTYSPDAYPIIYKWICNSTDKENHPNTTNTERGIRAKMIIYVHRFALIMQMMEYGISKEYQDKESVKINACKAAIALADYFIAMAEKMRLKAPYELLTGQLKELYDFLPEDIEFTTANYKDLCQRMNINERTARNYLRDNIGKLWVKIKHGVYSKIV